MMFHEIKVRQDGEEKWVDARKWFDYMCKEYGKANYGGKTIDPYADRLDNFFENIPDKLIQEWQKAYPNVNIKEELAKAKAWLVSNTSKAKKDLKRFCNNWLARAMDNGGKVPIESDKKLDAKIRQRKKYIREAEERANANPASQEDIRKILTEGGWKK